MNISGKFESEKSIFGCDWIIKLKNFIYLYILCKYL